MQQCDHHLSVFTIECACRFISKDKPWFLDERPSNRDALLFPSRKFQWAQMPLFAQPTLVQVAFRSRPRAIFLPPHVREWQHDLFDGRQGRKKIKALKDKPTVILTKPIQPFLRQRPEIRTEPLALAWPNHPP